jgi:dTDP-glucose 4,6-dehydratase
MVILNALEGKVQPIYVDVQQTRDWPHVEGHARLCFTREVTEGEIGVAYNIIGDLNEKTKLEIMQTLCDLLEEFRPRSTRYKSYRELIAFLSGRPGHDNRYAIYALKIDSELGWVPEEAVEHGRRQTVERYRDNIDWCQQILDGSYHRERLGLGEAF